MYNTSAIATGRNGQFVGFYQANYKAELFSADLNNDSHFPNLYLKITEIYFNHTTIEGVKEKTLIGWEFCDADGDYHLSVLAGAENLGMIFDQGFLFFSSEDLLDWENSQDSDLFSFVPCVSIVQGIQFAAKNGKNQDVINGLKALAVSF